MVNKRFLSVIVGWMVACTALLAQTDIPTTLQDWAARVEKFGKSIPQEQIFIHMDNTCYFLSDTIYYKAYVKRSDTGAPSNLSGLLYAELLNQDGYLVERQLIELKGGMGEGSFCLPDTLYGGYYELRAYTRWQLNWGETEHSHTKSAENWFFSKKQAYLYYRDYEKLYSRVFPVYDKPQNPGEFYHDMTLRPLRRIFKADNEAPKAVLTCYPEGGNLVAGAECRVAFEANDEEGKHLEGTITVTDSKGASVAEGKTDIRGRGLVAFTPKAGEKYKGAFVWDKGKADVKLPETETDGVAVQVTQQDGKVQVRILPRGAAASEELGLTVMHQGRQLLFLPLEKGETLQPALETAQWPSGVIQLTVFNDEGRIYADRLFFLRQNDFVANNLTFEGVKPQYEPFSSIEMGIKGGTPGGTVSVAVRDAGHTEYLYDNASILSEMLLSSQIRGFVENPEYYFEKDDPERRAALDLLLMIQGWRRYDWHTMAVPGAFVLQHLPEKTQLMQGEVNRYSSIDTEDTMEAEAPAEDNAPKESETTSQKARDRFMKKGSNLKREMLLHAEFTKPGAEEGVVGEMMTQQGMFSIESPRFYEQCYFFLAASDSTKWKEGRNHLWIQTSEDNQERVNYPEFYVKLNPIHPRFVKPYTWYQCNLADVPKGSAMSPDWLNDGSRTLETVTVGARRNKMLRLDANKPAYVIDAYEAFNDVCDAGFCTGTFVGGNRFATDIARTYIGDMNMDRQYEIEIRHDTHTQGFHMSDEERNKYNHLPKLGKVYVYTDYSPRREGDKKFEQSNQPIVTVDLRLMENDDRRPVHRDRRYILKGYAVCEDFYQPDYTNKPLPEHVDYRRTLYWNPSLVLDQAGAAQIRCFNNGRSTQVTVSAEGMGTDGTLLTGREMPEDRK